MLLIKMKEYCLSLKSDEETKIQNSHALYGRKLGYAYMGDFDNIILGLKNKIVTKFTLFIFI